MGIDIRKFVGCDLGDQFSHLCVINADGDVEKRVRCATNREAMTKALGSLGEGKLRVVIETGTHSPWTSRLVEKLGHEVVVANSRKVQLIYGSENKSDREDAERLARLGRADVRLLCPVVHRSEEAQQNLVPIKMRAQLVQTRTKLVNFVRGIAKSFGIKVTKCDAEFFDKKAKAQLPEELLASLGPVLRLLEQVTAQINQLDKTIEKTAKLSAAAQALTQINGVGALTAQTFIYTLDKANRFKRSRSIGTYLGLTPARAQSGKGDPQLRITKCGDTYLRSLLINCANYIMGPFGKDSDLRRHGLRIAEAGGKNGRKRALVAVARKLAVLMHRLWVTGEEYKAIGYAS